MSFLMVKNGKGTSERKPPSGHCSWLCYWEKLSGSKANRCLVEGCNERAKVGAHVYKVVEKNCYANSPALNDSYYIAPMCDSCNHPENEGGMIVDERRLVPEKI